MSLALDEPKESDESFDASGYVFLVDRDLSQQAGDMTVDMSYMGFSIKSSLVLGGGGCGGSCSTGSSCSC